MPDITNKIKAYKAVFFYVHPECNYMGLITHHKCKNIQFAGFLALFGAGLYVSCTFGAYISSINLFYSVAFLCY